MTTTNSTCSRSSFREHKPYRIQLFDDEPVLATRQEMLDQQQACAIANVPFRSWAIGDPGWITMDAERRIFFLKKPWSENAKREACKLLSHQAQGRAWTILEGWPLKTVVEYAPQPSMNIETVGVTPIIMEGFGRRAMIRWSVQSVDIDDQDEEFSNLDKAIIRASVRALEAKLTTAASQPES